MKKLHLETPLLESLPLSRKLGLPVFLKMEALQPSGSFKNRGIGLLCFKLASEGAKIFISSSGGNAGLAVAYSGRQLGIPVKVFVPETTPAFMQEKMGMEGAEVIVKGRDWDETDTYAQAALQEPGSVYVSPFDHPLIWEGHSTLIEEIDAQGLKPGAILTAVGGGGLLCGILQGLQKLNWQDVSVITAETEGAASFALSWRENKRVRLKEINTIATSLGAKIVSKTAFERAQQHTMHPEIVTDQMALDALITFLDDHRILVEPACGAALSLVYNNLPLLHSFSSLLIVVCGGCVVSRKMLSHWQNLLDSNVKTNQLAF